MIRITDDIQIDERELQFDFIRSPGPGGQNVNKVATAAQLRFNVYLTQSPPEEVRARLIRKAKNRINARGELIITARRFRTQEQNRHDAVRRLQALILSASVAPKPRRHPKPSLAAKRRRLEEKRRLSEKKRQRRFKAEMADE